MRRKTFLIPVLLTGLSLLLAFTPDDKKGINKQSSPDHKAPGSSVRLSQYANLSAFEQESLFPFYKWKKEKQRDARAAICAAEAAAGTPTEKPKGLAPAQWPLYWWDFIGTTYLDEWNKFKYIMAPCQELPTPGSCNDYPFNVCSYMYTGLRICKIKAPAYCGEGNPECYHPNLGNVISTWYKTTTP
jgi:hypothetical protein